MVDAIVPTNGNTISQIALAVRRLVLMDRARTGLGGAQAIADALGITRRAVNHKLVADRNVTDAELAAIAMALDAKAAHLASLAADLRAVCTRAVAA